jgi:hypothetical protein
MTDGEPVLELRTGDGLAKLSEVIEDEFMDAVDRAAENGDITFVLRGGKQVAAIVPAGALGIHYA